VAKQPKATTRALEAKHTKATTRALKRIGRLDLKQIVSRTARDNRWTERRADNAELWYKNFLKLCYLNRRQPVAALGRDADILWHQHILDTIRYQRDCKALFGHYLNHDPIDGRPSAADRKAFDRSRKLYLKEFGELPAVIARVCLRKPPPIPPVPPH
jgi:hypothetical protein